MNFFQLNTLILLCFLLGTSLGFPMTSLKVGITNSRMNFNDNVHVYLINTNYKHMTIDLKQFDNVAFIQIADKLNIENNEIIINECAGNVSICQNREMTSVTSTENGKEEINFDSKMCVKSLYLIMKAIDSTIPSAFNATINFILNEINEDTQYINETPFAFCGESNLEDCRNCGTPSCTVIQCGYEVSNDEQEEQFHMLNELCLPYSTEDNQIRELCMNFYQSTTYRPSGNCDYGDSAGHSFVKMIVFCVIIVGTIIISLGILYYHVYLVKRGFVPFYSPSLLPEFLLPSKVMFEYSDTIENEVSSVNNGTIMPFSPKYINTNHNSFNMHNT